MKRRIIINCLFLLLLYSRFYILDSAAVMAQQVSLSITPPIVEALLKPGKSILIAYTVGNLADPSILTAKVVTFKPLGVEGGIKLEDELQGPIRFSLENANLKLEQPFFLNTKDSQQLLLKMRAPDSIPDGDYYYTLLVSAKPPKGTEGAATSRAKATIGSNIIITVTDSGRTDVRGRIVSLNVVDSTEIKLFGRTYNFYESTGLIPVRLVVENYGDNVIRPKGSLTLTGNFGERATYDLLPQNILARSQRVVQASQSAQIYRKPVSLVLSGFFVGKYSVGAKLHFGEATPSVFATTEFFALPIKLIIGLAMTLIVTIYLVRRLTRDT